MIATHVFISQFKLIIPAAIAQLVERRVCGSGGRGFEPRPGPTKDFKIGSSGFPPNAKD